MRVQHDHGELWDWKYFGPVRGRELVGHCAACAFSGPPDWFRVWYRGLGHRVLCAQCSSDVQGTMRHEGWQLEDGQPADDQRGRVSP